MQTCEYCGIKLVKRDNETLYHFSKRLFCSTQCSGKAKVKKRTEKYIKYVEAGILKEFETMTFRQIAERHSIPIWKVKEISDHFNISRRKLQMEATIKRNREIAKKVKAGVSREELKREYGLSDYMIRVIGGTPSKKKPFELNGIKLESLGAIWDVEINVKPRPGKYSFFATNKVWN